MELSTKYVPWQVEIGNFEENPSVCTQKYVLLYVELRTLDMGIELVG